MASLDSCGNMDVDDQTQSPRHSRLDQYQRLEGQPHIANFNSYMQKMAAMMRFPACSASGAQETQQFHEWMRNNLCIDGSQEQVSQEQESLAKKRRTVNTAVPNNFTTFHSANPSSPSRKMVLDEMCASEYLNQLLQDKTTVSKMPKIFLHSERLLDEEINRVRNDLFSPSCFLMSLPKAQGPVVKLTEKVYAKVKEFPKFNFVGRIIGPRGLTLRQVEQETGCKLLVRGRGSMKDKKMEEDKLGQPNYEHLSEELHVLIMVEDTEDRARLKLQKAREEVAFLLQPPKDGEDEIKRKQLQDLAILNGTYRPQQDSHLPAVPTAISPSLQSGLMNFPSPPQILASSSATSYPGVRGNPVSSALQSLYPLDQYSSGQRSATASFFDFANFDPMSLLTGKR